MIHFKEIKKDWKNAYNYMEYEGTWYKYNYTLILEVDNASAYPKGCLLFSFNDGIYCFEGHIDMMKFDKMTYKEFIKYLDSYAHYNTNLIIVDSDTITMDDYLLNF